MHIAEPLMHAPEQVIDLGHAQLPYWRFGEGPDLVFVHGWPVDARTWRNVVPRVAERFTCHLIDLPGAGRSTWTAETPRGCEGLTRSLGEAIAHMALGERFGFVAFDSGGGFARKVAATMPERVTGMVMGNTETPKDYSRLFLAALGQGGKFGRKWMMRAGLQLDSVRVKSMATSVVDPALQKELADLFVLPLAKDGRRFEGAFVLADGLKPEDFDGCYEAHQRITAPVHFVWGVDDPWFELAAARRMLGQFAGPATLHEVPGARLFVHEEHPALFAEQVVAHFS